LFNRTSEQEYFGYKGNKKEQQSVMAFSLKDFSTIKKIGDGSMGTVYSAIHKSSKRKVVIKEFDSGVPPNDVLIKRLADEARASVALVHDNIARVFDFGEEDGSFYISREYIDGWDFEHLLRQPRPIPLAIGVMIVLQALKGLFHAHGRGIVHGDVNPDNILISKSGRVKVVDFGLASALALSRETIEPSSLFRLPAYVPPEVIMGGRQRDVFLDIWSCGVLAYRILAGRFPFFSKDPAALTFSIVYEKHKDIRLAAPVVPETVAGTVFDCLNKDKRERPPTLGLLIETLENYIVELGVRDIQKCVADYLNGPFRIPPYLTGLLVRYHLRKGEVMRNAGDMLGSEAHFSEVDRYGARELLPKNWRITRDAPEGEGEPGQEKRHSVNLSRQFRLAATALIVGSVLSIAGILSLVFNQKTPAPVTVVSETPLDSEAIAIIAAKSRAREQAKAQEHARDSTLQAAAAHVDSLPAVVNDTPEALTSPAPRSESGKRKKPAVVHSIERPSIQQVGAAMVGTLVLIVDPPQAHVMIDGIKITNLALSEGARLTVGSHSLAVVYDGYITYNSTVRIERSETQTLTVSLKALEKGTGLLHVHSYPWAEVYVDDVDKGPCPTQQPLALSEGDHVVLIKRDGFKPYTETVHIAKGEEARLKVELLK
jgi:serine/threonine protein kinase